MPVNETLAEWSNWFVYAAMTTYAMAFVAFAASFAAGRASATRSGSQVAARGGSTVARAAVAERAEAPVAGSVLTATEPGPEAPMPGDGSDSRGRKSGNIAMSLTWLSTLLLLAGVGLRGFSAGRAPWGNMYEFSITSACAVAAVFLAISTRRDLRWLGVFVVGLVLLTLGVAVTLLYTESAQLVPALKSWWLVIHVMAAIVSAGAFTVGAAVTVLYLIRARAEKRAVGGEVTGWLASRVPSAQRLDALAYRTFAFVFPLWTFAVIAGAIWAENAWGRYWGWDPKETWAFITWVIFAGYLHARATAGWRGGRAAAIALVGYGAFLFNYFGVNMFITGLHSYSGVS